jgi:CrcB protein
VINLLLIFLGAGCGGVLRYGVSNGIYWLCGRQFPIGTLVVNVSGSFIMGVLFVLLMDRLNQDASQMRALMLIGFLGGYTTFSSFSIETITLIENGALTAGVLNVLLSVILCLSGTWLGIILGRQI